MTTESETIPTKELPISKKKSALDSIPTIWIGRSDYDERRGLKDLEKITMSEINGGLASERKFVVADVKVDGKSKTIIRTAAYGNVEELQHKGVAAALETDLNSKGMSAEISVRGGGFIAIDYSKKIIYFECFSKKYGPAEDTEVKDLLSKGLDPKLRNFKIEELII